MLIAIEIWAQKRKPRRKYRVKKETSSWAQNSNTEWLVETRQIYKGKRRNNQRYKNKTKKRDEEAYYLLERKMYSLQR